jgi:hypothetical protein
MGRFTCAQDCSGSVAIGADDKFENNAGSCIAVEKDGDRWWLEYHVGPQAQSPTISAIAWSTSIVGAAPAVMTHQGRLPTLHRGSKADVSSETK